jgi:hypothetical protein
MREAGSVARNASAAAGRRGQKFFLKFFVKTLKFPKTRPITYPDDRDWVEKIFANHPKVCVNPSDNGL